MNGLIEIAGILIIQICALITGGPVIRGAIFLYSTIPRISIYYVEASGYAPLDPRARAGMCYSGNRRITASGAPVQPNVTIATGSHIPFNTLVWVQSLGPRIVADRGGKIKGNKIDVCFKTRKEALQWGRRKVWMIVLRKSQKQHSTIKGGNTYGHRNTAAQYWQNRAAENAGSNGSRSGTRAGRRNFNGSWRK